MIKFTVNVVLYQQMGEATKRQILGESTHKWHSSLSSEVNISLAH